MLQQLTRKKYTARLWMAESFPLSMRTVLHVMRVLLGTTYPQLVSKLEHFCTQEMPPGFPVRITVPVMTAISVDVAIVAFREGPGGAAGAQSDRLFTIPANYTREEESEAEQHKRQQKYRKRWKAADAKKKKQAEANAGAGAGAGAAPAP